MRAGSEGQPVGGTSCGSIGGTGAGSGVRFDRAPRCARRTGRIRYAALALITSTIVAAAGCDCERARDRMHETADQGFSQAWDCCKALQEMGLPSAESCFLDLKDWRQEITTLIIRWYQACLAGNQSLADSILRTMRRLFAEGVGTCGTVVADVTGQRRTIGLAIAAGDTATFDGDLGPVPRTFGGSDKDPQGTGADPPDVGFDIDGTVDVRSAEIAATVRLRGRVAVGRAIEKGSAPIRGFTLSCELPGGGELRLASRDVDASNRLIGPAPDGSVTLEVRCAVEMIGALPILVPSEVWLQLPLVTRGSTGGYAFAGGKRSLREVLPPAWGYADFNRDGFVDEADIVAYRSAAPHDRDLDLDGDADDDDDRAFIAAWMWGSGAG